MSGKLQSCLIKKDENIMSDFLQVYLVKENEDNNGNKNMVYNFPNGYSITLETTEELYEIYYHYKIYDNNKTLLKENSITSFDENMPVEVYYILNKVKNLEHIEDFSLDDLKADSLNFLDIKSKYYQAKFDMDIKVSRANNILLPDIANKIRDKFNVEIVNMSFEQYYNSNEEPIKVIIWSLDRHMASLNCWEKEFYPLEGEPWDNDYERKIETAHDLVVQEKDFLSIEKVKEFCQELTTEIGLPVELYIYPLYDMD